MKFYVSSINGCVDLTTEEIKKIAQKSEDPQTKAKRLLSQVFTEERSTFYLKQAYGTTDIRTVLADAVFVNYCTNLIKECEDTNSPEEDLLWTFFPNALELYSDHFRFREYQKKKGLKDQPLPEKQKAEAVLQMSKAGFSEQAIRSFENGEVLASDENGKLRSMNEFEVQLVKDFEKKEDVMVFHVLKTNPFADKYCFLFVSNFEEDWEDDREDLTNNAPFALTYNFDIPDHFQFKIIKIRKSDQGGFILIE